MQKLILFTSVGCHLCERAVEEIEQCFQDCDFTYHEVDIASDPNLLRKYGTRVPVLLFRKSDECLFWPFDHFAILKKLDI
jgi:glutaredoxin-related protein